MWVTYGWLAKRFEQFIDPRITLIFAKEPGVRAVVVDG
jgi:hypothetical protein